MEFRKFDDGDFRNHEDISASEVEFRAGRGKPLYREADPGCKKCNGGGFMDDGAYKVYCGCRYSRYPKRISI